MWFLLAEYAGRLDAVSFVSHGSGESVRGAEDQNDEAEAENAGADALAEYAVNLNVKGQEKGGLTCRSTVTAK